MFALSVSVGGGATIPALHSGCNTRYHWPQLQPQETTMPTKLLTWEQVRDRLDDRVLKRVAEECDIPYLSLIRIKSGTQPPKYDQLERLSEYLA